MFIPAQGVCRLVGVYDYAGQAVINTHFVSTTETQWTQSDLLDIAEVYAGWWVDEMRSLVPATVTPVRVEATGLNNTGDFHIVHEDDLGGPGTSGTTSMPNHVTVAVKWGTGRAGRSYRGRTYHIGLSNTQVTGNQITSAHQTALQAAYRALIAAYEAHNRQLVVCSFYSNGEARVSGVATVITTATIDRTIDSQRRRLPGRGT